MPKTGRSAADDEFMRLAERLLRQLRLLIPLIGQIQLTLLEMLKLMGQSDG